MIKAVTIACMLFPVAASAAELSRSQYHQALKEIIEVMEDGPKASKHGWLRQTCEDVKQIDDADKREIPKSGGSYVKPLGISKCEEFEARTKM